MHNALIHRTLMFIVAFGTVLAHHGKDYLVTASYKMSHKGDAIFILGTEIRSIHSRSHSHGHDQNHEFSFEPGLLFGLKER